MNVKEENVNHVTEDEILMNTHGEVRKMIEKILNAPDIQVGDHITVAIEKIEARKKTFMEIFNYLTPIVASIKQHNADSKTKLAEAAETYIDDLKYEFPSDHLSPLLERCTSFEFLTEKENRIGKRFMIVFALFPEGRGLEKLLLDLRSEISQCIITGKCFKSILEKLLSGTPIKNGEQVFETISAPKEPPVRDPAKEATNAELMKQQMKTGRVDKNLILIPRPTILGPSSIKTLLAPVVAQMTDYPVFAEKIRIRFDVWNGYHVYGCQQFGNIAIYVCELVFSRKINENDMIALGRETVRALAHEFRHSQQELLWDTDIPVVSVKAMASEDDFALRRESFMHYKNDPGEVDARDFAEKVVNAINDERYLCMVGRLARRCFKRQILAYGKLSLGFLEKKIAECPGPDSKNTQATKQSASPSSAYESSIY